ncbi:hypothetical protein HPG69_008780 [Diceros bicornis minor]|uniref:Uncharacterized protein n=1 Tax=Diceros bicornis minor TaxID=77932 RepID=A0A7J7FAL5_DICBM|nr:hypothetical protein HPG69_008780 [Diceros bicornis minor]
MQKTSNQSQLKESDRTLPSDRDPTIREFTPNGNRGQNSHRAKLREGLKRIGKFIFLALNGFVLAVIRDMLVFSASPTMEDSLGFPPPMCFICQLRCLQDNSFRFLAMNFQGRLKSPHGQNKKGKDGSLFLPSLAFMQLFPPTVWDVKGKNILEYTKAELCTGGSGY